MPQQTWVGETLGGRYRVDELLGKGGMSAVYKSTDPNLRRVVAIKLIHPHLSDNPDFVTRFKEEAAAVAQLRHPNIVQVFDFNNDGDNYYMVMEFVPGETLQARLKRLNSSGRQMDQTEMLKYGINLCDAVDYAHKRGLIHRDIKPANIMLDVHNQAILMDFGIAKIMGGQYHTATGATIGTALYMSPEQIKGERVDERCDLYSIGVTLYEMVSGRPPFEADSAMTTMMMHLNDPVPDLRQILPNTPVELIAIIEKSLAKDRDKRYQSAAEISVALRKILDRSYASAAEATFVSDPSDEPVAASEIMPENDATLKQAALASTAMAAADLAISPEDTPKVEGSTPVAKVVQPVSSNLTSSDEVLLSSMATASGAGGSIPPPAPPGTQATGSPAAPSQKRGISVAWLAGGAATLLIVLVIIFFASGGFSGLGASQEATETVPLATLASATSPPATATNTSTEAPPPTATYTTAPTKTATPTDTPIPEPYVGISRISVMLDSLGAPSNFSIEYTTENFTESRTEYHIHFFFNTVMPENAGKPGTGPWELYYGPSPFTRMQVNARPANATQICALVANSDHTLYYPASGELNTGNCWDIPTY